MKNTFLTVSTEAQEEIVINKSRFIGYVSPCETEQEAVSFLQKIREAHKTAKHHCYAYIIGENCGTMTTRREEALRTDAFCWLFMMCSFKKMQETHRPRRGGLAHPLPG